MRVKCLLYITSRVCNKMWPLGLLASPHALFKNTLFLSLPILSFNPQQLVCIPCPLRPLIPHFKFQIVLNFRFFRSCTCLYAWYLNRTLQSWNTCCAETGDTFFNLLTTILFSDSIRSIFSSFQIMLISLFSYYSTVFLFIFLKFC